MGFQWGYGGIFDLSRLALDEFSFGLRTCGELAFVFTSCPVALPPKFRLTEIVSVGEAAHLRVDLALSLGEDCGHAAG